MNQELRIKNNNKRGFTLIELLVVISIIVIIVSMGITTFAPIQRKSRDAKRKADLRDMKNALEQYYSICNNVYPDPNVDHYDPIICWSPVTQGILEDIPKDPKTGEDYLCPTPVGDNCNSTNFVLCATLEASDPNQYCVLSGQ